MEMPQHFTALDATNRARSEKWEPAPFSPAFLRFSRQHTVCTGLVAHLWAQPHQFFLGPLARVYHPSTVVVVCCIFYGFFVSLCLIYTGLFYLYISINLILKCDSFFPLIFFYFLNLPYFVSACYCLINCPRTFRI